MANGERNKKKAQSTKKSLVLLVLLKGLGDGYSYSEVEREQADEMTEIRRKKHSGSSIKIYLSPEANLLLAGYI